MSLLFPEVRQSVLHLIASGLATAEAQRHCESRLNRSEYKAECDVRDVIGDVHRTHSHCQHESEDRNQQNPGKRRGTVWPTYSGAIQEEG